MPNTPMQNQETQNTTTNNSLYIGIVAILLVGAALAFFQTSQETNTSQPAVTDQAVTSEQMTNEVTEAQPTQQYQTYSPQALEAAQASDNAIVLFFHATWCPSCRALDGDITSNLAEIPENLTIFKVDYDAEIELKQKYSVTTQHTLIQIDSSGKEITKWSGGSRIEQLLEQVQN